MMGFALIALGGAMGAVLRVLIYDMTIRVIGIGFPWGTIFVNLLGCFIIGLLWGLFSIIETENNLRLFLFSGLLGGFTTFSTFALENLNLFKQGDFHLALLNISISNIIGIFLVFMGFYITKIILSGK